MCKFETADNEYPLTSYQKDVWLEQIFYPQQPVYNVGGYYHIKGELSHEILEEALNKVINNNKALRIQIVEKEGKPYQKILPKIDYKLPYKDFSDKENPYDYALKWAQEKFVKIFSFDSFLFDFTLIKLGTDNHLLYLKGHHLIGDGWGFSLMYTRIVKIYNQLINNNLQSDQTEDHYIDYIQANLDYLNSKRYEKDLEFWKDKFQQLPEPLFTNKNKINDLAAEEKTLVVERDFYDKLIDLCANNNVSMFHFMLGILALYFSKVCRRQEIVIGVPILNRRKKYKKTIGHFANVIPLKVELKNDLTFIELAQNIKRELRRCYRHIKSSSSDIYRILSKDNTSQRNLYDICLSYENLDYNYHFANTHTEKVTLSAKCEDTPFALFIREFTDDEDVKIDFHYQLNVFEDFIPIENLIQHFEYLLTTLVTNGHQKIDKIEIIPPQEKEKILHQFNDRRTNDPLNKTLPELFVEQVEKTPDKTAIITVDKKLTYKELNERANQIARVLRTKGVTQKTVVGLMLENSVEMIVGTLATLKAGGAYLPLSCGYSTKQKKYILEDSEVEIILVSKEVDNQEIFTEEIINLANQDLYQKKKTNLARQMPPTNLAYLNYIFDSTEQQKGVMIEQRGIVNLIKFFINEFNLTAADNVLKFAAIDNDISIAEIFLTLLSGASLYIAPETVKDDYAEVIEYLNKII